MTDTILPGWADVTDSLVCVLPLPNSISNLLPSTPSSSKPSPGLSLQQIRGYLLCILLENYF